MPVPEKDQRSTPGAASPTQPGPASPTGGNTSARGFFPPAALQRAPNNSPTPATEAGLEMQKILAETPNLTPSVMLAANYLAQSAGHPRRERETESALGELAAAVLTDPTPSGMEIYELLRDMALNASSTTSNRSHEQ